MKQTRRYPKYEALKMRVWVSLSLGMCLAFAGAVLVLVSDPSSDIPISLQIIAIALLCYGTGVFDADRIIYRKEHEEQERRIDSGRPPREHA